MTHDPKPESEMYVTDVVRDGPETRALVSIKRIKAGELTREHIGKYLGCHDRQAGASYGAKIMNIIRQDQHRDPGMLVWIRHPAVPVSAATGDGRSVALIQLLGEVDHRGAGRVRLHNTAYSEDTAWAHRQITQAA